MNQQIIAVLYGGKSGEHQVSRISASSVLRKLDRTKYTSIAIGISEDGRWYLQKDAYTDPAAIPEILDIDTSFPVSIAPGIGVECAGEAIAVDCVFPVLHGTNGEDGTVQGLLEIAGLPYAGAGILASAFAMDKIKAKDMWQMKGISVVPYASLTHIDYEKNSQNDGYFSALYDTWKEQLGMPVFIKPCRAGSSVGISKISKVEQLPAALEQAFRFDTLLLIEQSVNAREIECSVLGNGEMHSFPPGEVISHHEFYDYSGKYLDPDGASFAIPADLSAEDIEYIRNTSVIAYQALGGEGLARVDFFVDRDNGNIYLNEINTMPGFTSISMYSKMCEAGGLPYTEILTRLIELAFDRYQQRGELDLHVD